MSSIRCPILQATVPSFDIRNKGALDLQIEITIEIGPDRDIGKSEPVTQHESSVCKQSIQELEVLGASVDPLLDGVPIFFSARGFDRTPKKRRSESQAEARFQPNPSIDPRANVPHRHRSRTSLAHIARPDNAEITCDSHTIVPSSSITGTRPCGFIALNSGVSRPPN